MRIPSVLVACLAIACSGLSAFAQDNGFAFDERFRVPLQKKGALKPIALGEIGRVVFAADEEKARAITADVFDPDFTSWRGGSGVLVPEAKFYAIPGAGDQPDASGAHLVTFGGGYEPYPGNGKGPGLPPQWEFLAQHTIAGNVFDVDIDSDNTKLFDPPEQSPDEEKIEEEKGKPGKFTGVNDGDSDADGIPNFADGYDRDGVKSADDYMGDGSFVPIIVKLPEGVDLAKAKIQIAYSASTPSFEPTGSGKPGDPHLYIPPKGKLRLWLKDGSERRDGRTANALDPKKRGDYVAPGKYSDITALGFAEDRTSITIYVEGISPSGKLGDELIVLHLDPEGKDDLARDAVRLTVVGVDLDVDSDNSRCAVSNSVGVWFLFCGGVIFLIVSI